MKKRGLALFLSLVLLLSMLPVSAVAAYTPERFTIVSRKSSFLAPGVTQEIVTTQRTDGKGQNMYYVATADLSRDDVQVYANFADNQWTENKLQKITEQLAAAKVNHSTPGTDRYIPYYEPVAIFNADFYDMSTGQPNGAFAMEGHIIQAAKGTFFAVREDGSAVIGRNTSEWNTLNAESPIQEAVGGGTVLVWDGKIAYTGNDTSVEPRTMVGVTADGKVVLALLDGRQAPFSYGGGMNDIAEMMLSLGCDRAINLDGGGSSGYAARQEGETEVTVVNRPSDGYERAVSSSLMIVSTTPPSDAFVSASLRMENDYLAPGAAIPVTAVGLSSSSSVVDIPADVTWQVDDPNLGSVTQSGVFTAGQTAGDVKVQMVYQNKVAGETTIHVVEPDELVCSLNSLVVPYGESVNFTVKAMYDTYHEVVTPEGAISLSLSEAAQGTLKGSSFTASSDTSAPSKGNLVIAYGALTKNIPITLGRASAVLFDFENDALDAQPESFTWAPNKSHAQYNIFAPNWGVVDRSTGRVRSGQHALALQADWNSITDKGGCTTIQLDYKGEKIDLTDAVGIGAWIWMPDEYKETNIRLLTKSGGDTTISSTNLGRIRESAYEEGCWVYLYQKINDSSNGAYISGDAGISFLQIELYASATCDPAIKSAAKPFTFYVDDITVDYSPAVPDREAPVFGTVNLSLANGSTALTRGSTVQCAEGRMSFNAVVQDDMAKDNYSGIDPNSAVVTVDGINVGATYKNGSLISQEVSLAAGVHTVRMAISDGAGNERGVIRQVNVTANTDVPTVQVIPRDAALNNLPLGSVYYVDVVATNVEAVQAVDLKLDLNDISGWELDYATVDSCFEMAHSVQDWHMGDNVATIRVSRKDTGVADTRTGEVVLASLPVRVWKGDATWTGKSVGQWPRDVSVEVDLGEITYTAGHEQDTLPGFSAARIQADTELNTWGNAVANSKWHVHTAAALEDKSATCTEDGYTGRTYCEGCKSVVEWGELTRGGHAWSSLDFSNPSLNGIFHCVRCQALYNGEYTNPTYGNKQYYKDGVLYTGWVDDQYYSNGTQQTAEFQMIEDILYRFTDGVCEGQKPYTGEYDGKGYQDGALHTGWLDNNCYYVDGVKQISEFQEIGGKWYRFVNGVCEGRAVYSGFMTHEENRYYVELGVIRTGKTVTDSEGNETYDGWFQAGKETCHACEGKNGALGAVTNNDNRDCVSSGYIFYTCSCGEQKMSEALWGEGHKWKSDTERVCTVCGKTAKDISRAKVSFTNSSYFLYTGSAIRPALTVTDNGEQLIVESDRRGRDGLVTFSNNTNVGIATVTIEGRGDYDEKTTLVAHFTIVPQDVPALRVKAQGKTTVTLEWDKAPGATYYAVYQKTEGTDWTHIESVRATTLQVDGLEFGKTYSFRIGSRVENPADEGKPDNEKDGPFVSANWTYSPEVTLAHLWDEEGTVTEPTCTEQGTIVHTCRHCGETETTYTDALGHEVAEWTVTKEPTIEETGTKTGHCSRCDQDVEEAIPSLKPYTISMDCGTGGTVTTDPEIEASEGTEVAVTATPAEDYELEKLTVTYADGEETVTVPVEDGKFTMPASDVTVTAAFKKTVFAITVSETENGTVTAPAKAKAGETVTVAATPAEGYELDQLAITYEGSILRSATQVLEGNTFTMPESDVTVTAVFTKIAHKITVEQPENGTVSVAQKAPAGETVTVTATPDSGYTLDRIEAVYQENGETKTIALSGNTFTMPDADVTVTVRFKQAGGGSSSGGGTGGGTGSGGTNRPGTGTEVKNPDGSTTTTETKGDGTMVETTTKTETKADGTKVESTTTVETKKDGTKVESTATVETKKDGTTVENTTTVETKKDGTTVESVTATETKPDGSAVTNSATTTTNTDGSKLEEVVETAIKPDGTKEESVKTTETKADGSVAYAARQADGTTAAATVDTAGKMEAEVALTEKAVAAAGDKPIILPLPEVPVVTDGESAPTVKVELPAQAESAKVVIPVQKADPAAVAVIVHPDGTEEIVRKSIVTEAGLSVPLENGATLKVVSNSKQFEDVHEDNWAAGAVGFASSRELFQGTGEDQFSPEAPMTRSMLVTVLYRLEQGEAGSGASSFKDVPDGQWYSDAVSWAAKEGIVTGYADGTFGGDDNISREQLAVLLYRYSGSPKVSGTLDFSDAAEASDWARDALIWAQQNKIMQGSGGMSRPGSSASRAEVAQVMMNYVNYLAAR